ncbi:MAG: hypothetical protein RL196_1544 [Actinomycetota bacterium]|jgi:ABC-type nickel/cobalt efflux system permease component RcnA
MINIDWNHLLQVALAAIVGGSTVVALFSLGIRLLVNAGAAKLNSASGSISEIRKEAANRAAAYVLFALSFGAIIFGVLLIIPGLIPAAA